MRQVEDYIVAGISSVPLSVTLTFMLSPFWYWLENATGLNVIGHFGPEKWCFFVSYAVFFGLFLVVQEFLQSRKRQGSYTSMVSPISGSNNDLPVSSKS